MSNEITVFDVIEEEVPLTKTERQLYYEQLAKEQLLDVHHYETLYEIEELAELKEIPVTNIPSILLKYVLKYCIPILANDEFSITLQNDFPIYGLLDGKAIHIASNQQFKVSGIKLPNILIRKHGISILSHYSYVNNVDISDSGRFGLFDFSKLNYTQQRFIKEPHVKEDIITFKDNDSAHKSLNYVIDYIKYVESFYSINFPMINYQLVHGKIDILQDKSWKIINGVIYDVKRDVKQSDKSKDDVKETPKQSSKIIVKDDKMDYDSKIRKQLDEISEFKTGDAFYFDMLFTMDRNGTLHAYHIGETLGTNDKLFQKEYAIKKKELEYKKEYDSQLAKAYDYFNKISLKNVIAIEKFNTDLEKLDNKQLKLVELEFNKRLIKQTSSNEKAIKLFNKLQSSFEFSDSEKLEEYIKEIEELIPKKQLEGDALLDGNLCPHIYQKGKILLDNFKNINLQNVLKDTLLTYALPESEYGYFCKICGEKLLDADISNTVTFMGEKVMGTVEDTLQTAIWKEAMFIVINNVKFKDPIPIKPLVNSLASGLRNIIAVEEAKLFRSKTSSAESVKDISNLYAAIYIYASLCAIMINNPGKLFFGRDKPADLKKKENKVFGSSSLLDNENDVSDENDTGDADDEKDGINNYKKDIVTKKGGGKKAKYKYVKGGRVISSDDIKKAEAEIVKTALILVISSKESIIIRNKSINVEIIKKVFSNAYKWANQYVKPIQLSKTTINKEEIKKEDYLSKDPYYNYNYTLKKLEYFNGIRNKYPKYTDVDIKSNDISLIKKWDYKQTSKPISSFNSLVKDIPSMNDYTYDSYMSISEYIKNDIYIDSVVPLSIKIADYRKKYEYLKPIDKKLMMNMYYSKINPFVRRTISAAKFNNFNPSSIDLINHFCPNGLPHKTGTFIYTDGKKETQLTKAQIGEWLSNNEKFADELDKFKDMYIIDEICEKCKTKIRSASSGKMSDVTLPTMFKKLDNINAFYQYFETRCPEGNLHDLNDGKCKKCGYNSELNKTKDDKYFDKYIMIYDKIQGEKEKAFDRNLMILNIKNTYKEEEEIKWDYSLKNTAEWSKISGVNYNILVNLGLTEGINYEDLQKGSINPSKEEYNAKTRLLKIKSYLLFALRMYNNIINYEVSIELSKEIRDIIEAQKKIDIKNISQMPKPDHINEIKDHALYCNYLQEYLAGLLIKISSKRPDKYKILADLTVKYITTEIIEMDRLLSKAKPFFYKKDITTLENASEDEVGISGDDWDKSEIKSDDDEFAEEKEVETYENDLDVEGFDVENAKEVWETE
jgi:hypothetical protein